MSLDLEAIELIKQLKYRYCNAIDTCDLETLKSLFTEDAAVDYKGATYHLKAEGRDIIIGILEQAFHPDFVGCHSVVHPIITVNGDGTATGIWRLEDYAVNLRDNNLTTVGAAIYTDDYVFQDGAWRIKRSAYTRIYERVFNDPNPAIAYHILGAKGKIN